ncbi:DUF4870 domain-containing protein [Deinococcus ficus]|uniref:DUF4870 domain-containing protein n=1 Tax=Deinococcus ficus TaxID=317577 RepID=UPI00174A13F9|nr:DUF4870 domain-containing protein [Deinococcus ficus]GHF69246.1 hypothetical protein GCM10017782_03390 [Deinococcus ficus]
MTATRSFLPVILPEPERTPALAVHLSPLLGLLIPGAGALIGPVAAWLLFRDRSRMLDEQGKEAVNFQISVWLYNLALGVLLFGLFALGLLGGVAGSMLGRPEAGGVALVGTFGVFLGLVLPLLLVLNVVPLVFMVLAAVSVNRGEPYRYPLTLRLLR